jgi:type VI secretion system protein ImpK
MRSPSVKLPDPSTDDDRTLLPREPLDDDRTLVPHEPADDDRTLMLHEPADDDRTLLPDRDATILMPSPGGQPTMVLPRAARAARPDVELQRLVAGLNPLLSAATVLLALVPRLRSTTAHADPAALREELLARVSEFEAAAAANGVPRPKIGAARYLLCSFVDETIAATPWGAGGVWAERNLLQEFHDERSGAYKSFELVERLAQDPAANADLLELFYVCLVLGFEGRWRGQPNGRAELDAMAERLLGLLRPAADGNARTLSLHWQGVAGAGRTRLRGLPLPALLALAGALSLAVLLVLHARLDDAVQPAFRRIAALPQALQLERAPATRARMAPLLGADIARGALAVRDETLRSVVTLPADALFERGGARLDPDAAALLGRVAQALKGFGGQVAVVGHSDDVATGSLQYPSNWHLTQARARAVVAALGEHGLRGERVHAEGRADAEPLAPNTTAEGRARNRRIEVELRLPRPDA